MNFKPSRNRLKRALYTAESLSWRFWLWLALGIAVIALLDWWLG